MIMTTAIRPQLPGRQIVAEDFRTFPAYGDSFLSESDHPPPALNSLTGALGSSQTGSRHSAAPLCAPF